MDVAVCADFRRIGNRSFRTDPRFLVLAMPVHEDHYLHESVVGILSNQKGDLGVRRLFANYYCACLGRAQLLLILAICQKTDITFVRAPERRSGFYCHSRIAADVPAYVFG